MTRSLNTAVLVTSIAIVIGPAGFVRAEVTLKGSLVCNGACVTNPTAEDHVMAFFAIDGTAEICAEVDRIVDEFFPEKGLDAEAAVKLLEQFDTRQKTVRLPSDAEWEYAARVGTSNPGFPEKFKEQNSTGAMGFKAPLKVRSKQPNAWGLYDMASCWWEITGERGLYNVRHSEEDPRHPPASAKARVQRSGRGLVKDGWSIGLREFITEKPDYTAQKFRVLVEADASPTK
jgi:Sulfatase-modifying factor enzyme 1